MREVRQDIFFAHRTALNGGCMAIRKKAVSVVSFDKDNDGEVECCVNGIAIKRGFEETLRDLGWIVK